MQWVINKNRQSLCKRAETTYQDACIRRPATGGSVDSLCRLASGTYRESDLSANPPAEGRQNSGSSQWSHRAAYFA